MAEQYDPFTLNESSGKAESLEEQARVADETVFEPAEVVNGRIEPEQTPEPQGAYMSWGVAAVIFAYVIPIIGILMAGIALSKVSNAKKMGYHTKKLQTTKVLGIVALILAAVTIIVSAIMLRTNSVG